MTLFAQAPVSAGDALTVASPDATISITFQLIDGRPEYGVTREGRPIVLPSKLGFRFRMRPDMLGPFDLVSCDRRSSDTIWRPVWGSDSEVRDNFNEMTVGLQEAAEPGRSMSIVFRAYNDGAAFRYVLPEGPGLTSFEIVSEETRFRFAEDLTAWWIPNDYDSYEHLYRETPLSELPAANTPVTMRASNGVHLSIHEANLTDYAGMTLASIEGEPLTLKCELVPWPDGVVKVIGSTPAVTPWRTIQISPTAAGLIESHLIENLNEPCAIDDTSWIRPMKYVGIWWGMHIGAYTWHQGPVHGATTENAKRYIDFAADHGIGGVLVEGWNTGWEGWGKEGAFDYVTPYDDYDVEAVLSHARERGVAIIGHHETGGDARGYEASVDSAFALCERQGIPAVKTGYAGGIYPRGQHHHGQWMVYHYRSVLEKAAAHRIMLDAHEPIKPTGIRRTYPNMMTREGVRGTEYNAWSEGNPPEHETILAFTRMLAGPLDYTPGIFDVTFDEHKQEERVRTTVAKQLALYVVFESPLQMAADMIENYEGEPAFAFIEAVPATWDETRAVGGEVGDHVEVARRSGREWFLGAITDEEARTVHVPLSFLTPGRGYRATVFADGCEADWETNPAAVDIDTVLLGNGDTLEVRMAPGGGQAVRFTPIE